MTEREALEEALALVREMQREQAGPFFPGKAHKVREVHLPELVRILKEGLSPDNVPKL